MSVPTLADKARDEVKTSLDLVIKNLSEIVIDQLYGWDNYTDKYQEVLQNALFDLIRIRKALSG